jgi:hypothetical protein
MISFGSAQVVPVFYVFFSLASIAAGLVLYREYDTSLMGGLLFALGLRSSFFWSHSLRIVITIFGVFLIAFPLVGRCGRSDSVAAPQAKEAYVVLAAETT